MAEASSIVEEALRDIAIIAQRETPSVEDAELGLARLNTMIQDWVRRGVDIDSVTLLAATRVDDGIADALRLNVAIRLAPAFGVVNINPALAQLAADTFAALNMRSSSPAADETTDTWGWLIADALQQANVILEGQQPSTAMIDRGLCYLNAMLGDWGRRGIVHGLTLPVARGDDITREINDPIRFNLAVRLAPAYGSQASNDLIANARETFIALMDRSSAPAPAYELDTWGWLITDSLQRSNVVMEGMRPSNNQVVRAFQYVRRITEQWTLDGLLNHAPFHVEPYIVAAGKEQFVYTIGADDTADIPVRSLATIQTISILYPYQNSYESVLRQVDLDTIIRQTRHDLSGTWPTMYYYEAAWPVGCIYFDIQPTAGTTISIIGRADWLDETNLEGAITLPQGYESALVDHLTIELAQAYQKPVSHLMYKMARKSKALLRRRNNRPRISVLPRVLMGSRVNGYSYTH